MDNPGAWAAEARAGGSLAEAVQVGFEAAGHGVRAAERATAGLREFVWAEERARSTVTRLGLETCPVAVHGLVQLLTRQRARADGHQRRQQRVQASISHLVPGSTVRLA